MKYRYTLLLLFLTCLCWHGGGIAVQAQPYQGLHKDYTTSKHSWYQQYYDRMVSTRTSKVQQQIVESFSNKQASVLYERFSDGSVVQDPLLEQYLNKVCDSLLIGDQLKYQVRIYPLWESSVNAFSHGSGTLFVTLGLLANIKNESALAFVIGHEVAHFDHNHAFKKYDNRIRHRQMHSLGLDNSRYTKDAHEYSREFELEADSIGMMYLKASRYNPQEAASALDAILSYPSQYTGLAFQPNWLNNRFASYSQEAFNDPGNMIAHYSPNSTHPSNIQRKQRLAAPTASPLQRTYLQPETDFKTVQTHARSLLTHTLLSNFQIYDALHNAYFQLQQNPNDIEQEYAILQILRFLLYARSIEHPSINQVLRYNTVGQPDIIRQYFSKLSNRDLAQRVLYYTVDRAMQYPNDTLIQNIALSVIDKTILDYHDTYQIATQQHPSIAAYQKELHRRAPRFRHDFSHLQRRSIIVAPYMRHYDEYTSIGSTYENARRSDNQYQKLIPQLQTLAHYNINLLTVESDNRNNSRVLQDIYTLRKWRTQQRILSLLNLPSFNQREAEAVMLNRGAHQAIFVTVNNLTGSHEAPNPSRMLNHADIEVYNIFRHHKVNERSFNYLKLWPDLIPLHIHRSVH